MAILSIPVTKGKATVDIDTDGIPQDVYEYALAEGLKVLVNRGMSKITTKGLEGAELDKAKAAAMAKAQENVEAIKAGKVRKTGGAKKTGVSGAVNTEAMRLARNLIKDEMKRVGIKLAHVSASEITAAAKEYLATDPSLIETAKANLEARQKVDVGAKINLKSLLKEDPELVAKAEARKAKAKADAPLSAKQAGKFKARAKGQPQLNA